MKTPGVNFGANLLFVEKIIFMFAFNFLKVWVVHSEHNLDESYGKNHVEFESNLADFQKCPALV